MSSFAYLFERFPSFTQTFCYREVLEMRRQGVTAPLYSIRRPKDIPKDCPEELARAVRYLPEPNALAEEMKTLHLLGRYPWKVIRTLSHWGKRPDKGRVLAAAWLGKRLQQEGVRHVHAHFAGIAARTAYWIKAFYGITYSFTGHAMFDHLGHSGESRRNHRQTSRHRLDDHRGKRVHAAVGLRGARQHKNSGVR